MSKRKIHLLLLALLFLAAGAEAGTFNVPGDFATIQGAVDAASSGDEVLVSEGYYTENVVIDGKNVSLRSVEGARSTVIEPERKSETILRVRGARGIVIEGFKLTGSDRAGLELRDVHASEIRGVWSTGNLDGILLINTSDNTVEGNSADENLQYGIYVEGSKYNIIQENTSSRNKDKGVFLSNSQNNIVIKNDSNLNTWNGFVLWNSNYNLIKDNNALRNTYGIVESESTGNVIMDNSTWPNIIIILPIILIYSGVLFYIIQKNVFKLIYKNRE